MTTPIQDHVLIERAQSLSQGLRNRALIYSGKLSRKISPHNQLFVDAATVIDDLCALLAQSEQKSINPVVGRVFRVDANGVTNLSVLWEKVLEDGTKLYANPVIPVAEREGWMTGGIPSNTLIEAQYIDSNGQFKSMGTYYLLDGRLYHVENRIGCFVHLGLIARWRLASEPTLPSSTNPID